MCVSQTIIITTDWNNKNLCLTTPIQLVQSLKVWGVLRTTAGLCSPALSHNTGHHHGDDLTAVFLFSYKRGCTLWVRTEFSSWVCFFLYISMRLSKMKDFTFPHSFNKSHLSNAIISRISITVNIFFCISVLTFYMTCTRNIITSMTGLEHNMTAYLSWRKYALLPDNG